jgi:serine/threonine-protein kinase RsbT
MEAESISPIEIASTEGIISTRQKVRELAGEIGFGAVDQTRIATAVSELARNIYQFAKKGTVTIIGLEGDRKGLKIVFEDDGPGIADIDLAMTDGYSTAKSMGLGLPGAKRLMDEFRIESEPGKGTKITITKWL